MPASPDPVRTLIDELIESQRRLDTPVARFAAAHAAADNAPHAPGSRTSLGAQLIPLSAPGPGEQYAFQVDLDSCTGCKACVSGCHSLNGLDDEETWRDVGLVYGRDSLAALAGTAGPLHRTSDSHASERNAELQLGSASCAAPFAQTVTTACHHCEDPACLNGCPVVAYEKDPITGIVVHLDDQCIGCSYCVLKCPYDVPKFNERLGIVRKCDMCHGRLAAGEAPACAQACPTQAISIVTVAVTASPIANPKSQNADSKSQSAEHKSHSPNPALTAFSGTDSAYTRPTTRYVSKKPLPAGLYAADTHTLRPQHAHYALVLLLVLTQLGIGLLLSSQLLAPSFQLLTLLGLGLYSTGLVASIAHLGQPLRAWRIFLGLRTSWLSREAVLLGMAFPLLAAALLTSEVAAGLLAKYAPPLPPLLQGGIELAPIGGLVIAGLGVFCSAMIYTDTRRQFWRLSQTLGRMGGTVAIAALIPFSAPLAAVVLVAKLALELSTLRGTSTSARLQRGLLSPLVLARLAVAGLAFAGFFMLPPAAAVILFGIGEILERTLFFRAVDSPKMPGVPAS
ncbi:MAG: dimethyl sulfoxide reductase anchor subunit [Opitutus sp.]|nr:dimethyl sulfoxide reductase anchor subunit [Opitutus sp.]MCS6245928.1 dimethyl sulfoxide reductase anchor subunit [Opitutus sp.]MCS6272934.1 dimethyl sulfoxide reductase anchor subunit [Opitutus sp.]MCS6275993.1 dimethyl sulfoxide reductase anchor subunit [Opitutus sp.]MCS6301088.1 dimethyl sulfoxide reductase anchor subunit [Opitutus sp.]